MDTPPSCPQINFNCCKDAGATLGSANQTWPLDLCPAESGINSVVAAPTDQQLAATLVRARKTKIQT